MGWNIGKWIKRATTVPAWLKQAQPLKALAETLGIGQATRDAINAVWQATEVELCAAVDRRFADLSAQVRARILRALVDEATTGQVNWRAVGGDLSREVARYRNLVTVDLKRIIGDGKETTINLLIEESLHVIIGTADR